MRARIGQVVLTSRSYASKADCENAIARAKESAPTDDRYERRTADNGQYYFVLKTANHQPIGQSELYTWQGAMENSIASIKKNAPHAPTEVIKEPIDV